MMRSLSPALAMFLLCCAGFECTSAYAQTPHTHMHSFSGAEHWARVFDDPQRDAWQKPHQVIETLALKPDAIVADIGAGTGYFAVRLAHFVPQGRVYAVDIEPDMVKYLGDRARREGLRNLTAVTGTPDDARLPAKVDLILMVDTYHHIERRERYFRRLAPSLRPGGRIAIIDFNEHSAMGPPPGARIAAAQVTAEMGQAGYQPAGEYRFLPDQYFLTFAPKQPD